MEMGGAIQEVIVFSARDAAVVVDLDLHPVGGDFVPNLIRMVPEEVGNP